MAFPVRGASVMGHLHPRLSLLVNNLQLGKINMLISEDVSEGMGFLMEDLLDLKIIRYDSSHHFTFL